MARPVLTAASLMILFLAACGTPQQQCEARVSAEYRNVRQLLAEVEGNLARGYAWQNEPVRSSSWRMCGSYYGGYGYGYGIGSCYGGPEVVRTRVAIDPAAEMRKRDALRARMSELASGGIQACQTGVDTQAATANREAAIN